MVDGPRGLALSGIQGIAGLGVRSPPGVLSELMDLLELSPLPPLTAPVLIAAFEGWVSAGSAGTATATHLAGDGAVVGHFDADALFDYRANRPAIVFEDGVLDEVTFPELTLVHRVIQGRDVLVINGTEPNWNWRRLGRELAETASRLGVVQHISLGGIPWATPHTRPTQVVITTTADGATAEGAPVGRLQVPGSAASIVEHFIGDRGIPTVGLWARVPHYVGATYYPAVVALVDQIAKRIGVDVPRETLVDAASNQLRELDALVAERPEAAAMVEQLEQLTDASADVASGEEIAAEIERFLRAESGESPGDPAS